MSALETLLAPTVRRAAADLAAGDDDLFEALDPDSLERALSELDRAALAGDDPLVAEAAAEAEKRAAGKRPSSLEALAAVRRAADALGRTPLPEPDDAIATRGGVIKGDPTAAAKSGTTERVAPIARPSGELYHPRRLDGRLDVNMLRACREAGINVLLDGMPGGGKTALVEAAFGGELETLEGNCDCEVSDFTGTWVQMPDGRYQWVWGPLASAMAEGKVLFVDDGTVIAPGVWARQYPAMDGRGRITVREYRNTEVVAQPGFIVVMAHNPDVPGAVLAEPLASRFGVHLTVESDLRLAQEKLGVDPRLVKVAATLQAAREVEPGAWAPEMRDLVGYTKVCEALGQDVALANFISKAPAHARDQVIATLRPEFGARRALVLC